MDLSTWSSIGAVGDHALEEACPFDLLAVFVEGEATASEARIVLSHVGRCEACRAVLADLGSGPSFAPLERRYRLERLLGVGGMGVVHEAWDTRLRRRVALKRTLAGSDAQGVDEARSIAAVRHENVVSVFDAGIRDGVAFIVMERVDGPSLRHVLEEPTLPRSHREALCLQTARGLAEIHRAGMIHGDVKPANILLSSGGTAKVVDFGLARSIEARDSRSAGGTRGYVAPEVVAGRSPDARSDQYGFCVAAYEILTGTRFESGSRKTAFEGGASLRPPTLEALPSRLRRILERGLAPNPDLRWPSMDALLEAWERRDNHQRWRRRIGMLVGALAVLGIWLAWSDPEPRPGKDADHAARVSISNTRPAPQLETAYDALEHRRSDEALREARAVFVEATAQRAELLASEAAIVWAKALQERDPERAYELLAGAFFSTVDTRPDLAFMAARELAFNTGVVAKSQREDESLWWWRHAQAALARSDGSGKDRARLQRTLGLILDQQGEYRQAQKAFETALEHLEAGKPDPPFALDLNHHLARLACQLQTPDCKERFVTLVQQSARVWSERPPRRAAVLVEAAAATAGLVDDETRLQWALEGYAVLQDAPSPPGQALGYGARIVASIYLSLGRPSQAKSYVDAALERGADRPSIALAHLLTAAAWAEYEQTHFDLASDYARRSRTLLESLSAPPSYALSAAVCESESLVALGCYEEARPASLIALQYAQENLHGTQGHIVTKIIDTQILLGLGRLARAKAGLREVEALLEARSELEQVLGTRVEYLRLLNAIADPGAGMQPRKTLEQMLRQEADRALRSKTRQLASSLTHRVSTVHRSACDSSHQVGRT